jgi:hypothetical protein
MWGGEREEFVINLACILMICAVNRWLSVRLNLFSAGILGLAAFVTILTPTIDAALAGFILAFATTVTSDVGVGVCMTLDDVLIPFADFVYGNVSFMTFLLDAERIALGPAVR